MKILVIGDLHGRRPLIKNKDFDCMVLVGDICDDKKIGPIYKKWFEELARLGEKDTFLDFEKFAAKYLGSKKKLVAYEKISLKEGNKILRYLDSFGKPIFMVAGNWDQSYGKSRIKDLNKNYYNYIKWFYDSWAGDEINSELIKGTKNVKNCMLHNIEFGGINFVGYGLSSAFEDFRMRTKKIKTRGEKIVMLKKAYDKIGWKLESVNLKRNKKFLTFFISHNIPYGTKLDKVKNKKSYAYGKHLGSTIARDFCRRFKPLICVGGHVHEGRGRDKIGRTIVVNPGYGRQAQVLVEVDTKKGKVKSVKFLN
ncbi:MAG: metallophosphoesterase [archaeon]